jgi:hypothetical protein
MMIPIVGPFRSEAAAIIHHAHMDALATPAELLRGIHCEDHRLSRVDHPHVVIVQGGEVGFST